MGIFDYLRPHDKPNSDPSDVKSGGSSAEPLKSGGSSKKSQPPPIPDDARVGRRSDGPRESDDGSIIYTVNPGDTLFEIAQRHLGDGGRWREIYRANANRIADPNAVMPGQELIIPTDSRHAD